jgi:5-methylcytosine-specific restriction endonuclease McrA
MNAVALRANNRCEYCGLDMDSSFALHMTSQADHVIPRKAGGTDDLDNLAHSCSSCNGYFKKRYVPKGNTREERIKDAWENCIKPQRDKELAIYNRRMSISAKETA